MNSEVLKEKALPKNSGKTTVKDLSSVPRMEYASGSEIPSREALFNCVIDGFKYDFLWKPKSDKQKKLFVLFSGDAVRGKNDPPVFQRWSWADFFPGHVLYFSDPSLYLDPELGLAWYAGTSNHEPMEWIAKIVREFAEKFDISNEFVISYGSSGGGYAAARFGLFLKGATAVCINPQVEVTRYRIKSVERYLRICFGIESRKEALAKFPKKLSLLENIEEIAQNKLIYVQNILDDHHYKDHHPVFISALKKSRDFSEGRFKSILFAHEGGHSKAETPEAFDGILEQIDQWLGKC